MGTGIRQSQPMTITVINGRSVTVTSETTLENANFAGCDLVLECTGKFKSVDALKPYLDEGIHQVVVAAPIKVPAVLNVVMGKSRVIFCGQIPNHYCGQLYDELYRPRNQSYP